MRNARAKWRLSGKMLGKMDRIAVPCDLGEADHMRGVDDLFKGLGHSDREIFEIKHLERQHFRVPRVIGPAVRLGRCSYQAASADDTPFEVTECHTCHAAHSPCHWHLCVDAARVGVFPEFGTKPARESIRRDNDPQPSIGCVRQSHQRPPISSTLMNASSVNTAMVALVPLVSIKSAPSEGARA